MTFLRMFKHLLPNARAWNLTANKQLRQFFDGLSGTGTDVKAFFDGVWGDLFPQTTRDLDGWESQFALQDTGLTEQERRDRLDGTWKALGGQDPNYIQTTLQNAGFPVFVHEWWEPGTEPVVGVKACVTPRNPFLYLRPNSNLFSGVDCGEPLAQCGEEFAQCGNSLTGVGYPLVNKIFATTPDLLVLCGEEEMQCGEEVALCGNFTDFRTDQIAYQLPLDQAKWPYFLYIGGETFPDLVSIPASRRDEFETLCLKICPAHVWLGILVNYT